MRHILVFASAFVTFGCGNIGPFADRADKNNGPKAQGLMLVKITGDMEAAYTFEGPEFAGAGQTGVNCLYLRDFSAKTLDLSGFVKRETPDETGFYFAMQGYDDKDGSYAMTVENLEGGWVNLNVTDKIGYMFSATNGNEGGGDAIPSTCLSQFRHTSTAFEGEIRCENLQANSTNPADRIGAVTVEAAFSCQL